MSCYNDHRPCFECGALVNPLISQGLCPPCHLKQKEDHDDKPAPVQPRILNDVRDDGLPMFDPPEWRHV